MRQHGRHIKPLGGTRVERQDQRLHGNRSFK
jgi:hypothetical protein